MLKQFLSAKLQNCSNEIQDIISLQAKGCLRMSYKQWVCWQTKSHRKIEVDKFQANQTCKKSSGPRRYPSHIYIGILYGHWSYKAYKIPSPGWIFLWHPSLEMNSFEP